MKFYKGERFVLKTHLDPSEVIHRLRMNTEPKKMLRASGIFASSDRKTFEGEVGRRFTLRRLTRKKNSYSPNIKGKIVEERAVSYIHIELQVPTFIKIFMSFWIVALLVIFYLNPIRQDEFNNPFFGLFPFLFVIGFVVISVFSFNRESKKIKSILSELLEAEETVHRSLIDKY